MVIASHGLVLQAVQQVSDPNQAPVQDILTPLDEVVFWSELATNLSLSGPATKAAKEVRCVCVCVCVCTVYSLHMCLRLHGLSLLPF